MKIRFKSLDGTCDRFGLTNYLHRAYEKYGTKLWQRLPAVRFSFRGAREIIRNDLNEHH